MIGKFYIQFEGETFLQAKASYDGGFHPTVEDAIEEAKLYLRSTHFKVRDQQGRVVYNSREIK